MLVDVLRVVSVGAFVLILGRGDPVGFIGAYTGLTLVGAAVGIAVSWAWPPLPLTPAQMALDAPEADRTRSVELVLPLAMTTPERD